jgi:hypothetical protein
MDPTACYLDMFAAMNRKNFAAARELALALKKWLDRGGFYPPNYTETEVKAYLASVLRRTAQLGE